MSKRAQKADVESGEGMGGGVECGEGLGVQAVMRDGAVHSGAGNEGWLRDGGGGVLVFIFARLGGHRRQIKVVY